ncbi:site-specific integrase [Cypionkella psychrotolerans]|uniref:site-specific integrase n=1 Tax=Cypionkella psychrotolerans TaxID=1678131 RepID=UPI0006B40A69|nr:site-specific integrase [Cypionkella psychrotolerans]
MRYDEIRTIVQGVLQQTLQHTIARLDNQGPLHKYNPVAEDNARSILAAGAEDYWEMVGPEEVEKTLEKVASFSGRPRTEIEASKSDVLELFRTGMLAYWNAVDDHRKKLQSVDLTTGLHPRQKDAAIQQEQPDSDSRTLAEVVALYIKEQDGIGAWVERTRAKQEATLGVLVELVGSATAMASISKKNAQDVKSVLLALPPNKNKNPFTRNLSLRDAAKVPGIEPMSPVTLNAYLSAFHTFTAWAVNNGYAKENPFEGMKVRGGNRAAGVDETRKPFPPEAIVKMVRELTAADSPLVKKESYRWASLIAIFTGARLNEVCALRASDVQEIDGIWCISINNDDPDKKKHLKTVAARRFVPLHSKLIEMGVLGFVDRRRQNGPQARLFPDFPYSPKHGFGRNQGRWFNETFLPALALKTEQHVFHSLRHTIVTRLQQAGVALPMVQTLVGHEKEGVTAKTYFSEGYKVSQLKEAIERFRDAEA